MLAKERQDIIYGLLQKNGAVNTGDLVNDLEVSIETIRRDLLTMEQNHLLKRVHGGAVISGQMPSYHHLVQRTEEHISEKEELSKTAMSFIREGDTVGIDTGSTVIVFAQTLKKHFSRLTVVTHSMDVFNILNGHEQFEVILCGGHYMPSERSFYGHLALNCLDKLHMQKTFLFPSAISLRFGLCDYIQELNQVQQKLIGCSDQIFILGDNSKFEKTALLKISDMNPDYTYITDRGLSPALKKIYGENGIRIITEIQEKIR